MEIHIRLAGEKIGPFSEKQVRQYMDEGLVTPSDMAMHDGMTDWQSVEEILANLPPPIISTPVFSDPEPLKEEPPLADLTPVIEPTEAVEAVTTPAVETGTPSTAPENTEDEENKATSPPIAPLEQIAAAVKKTRTGKTAISIEPPRSTTSLPPVIGFVPKEKSATKPLPKLGQLALRDVPGKIEATPAAPDTLIAPAPSSIPAPAPIAPPAPAKSSSVETAPDSPPLPSPEIKDAPEKKSWLPIIFRTLFYLCCALSIALLGFLIYGVYLIISHPGATSARAQPPPASLEGTPKSADEFTARGLKEQSSGDLDRALSDYEQAVKLDPKNAKAYFQRGLARNLKDDSKGALADYNQAVRLDPQNVEALGNRASVKHALGDLDGALADYDQAIALDPKNIQLNLRRALVRQLKGDLHGASADYDVVLASDSQNADAFSNRAYVKQSLGDLDGALADYHQAVVLNPKSAIAFYNVGLIKVKQGDLDGAILAYNYALELDPKMAIAYYNRGNAKNTEGDLDGAVADYTQALVLDPKIALAYCNRGFARQTKGDMDGALADYAAALQLNAKMEIVYYNRGLIRVQLGDLDGAIDDSSSAIELNAKDGPAYCNRGLARMGKGNLDGALADLRQFCELSPRDVGTDSAHLYIWLIATQLNPKGTADQDLTTALQNDWNSPPEEFTSKIGSFLLGHIRENELIANAASPDLSREPAQYCKAWYFAGMKRLLAGDKKTAINYFQKCVATNQKDYCEHIFARAELTALGQNTEAAPKAPSPH